MANEKRLIDANALSEFFQERYEYLRNASEKQLPGGYVQVDLEIQCGAIIAKEFLDKTKDAPTVDAVEVVHGRWVLGNANHREYMKCSVCIKSQTPTGVFTYCPNCGAKMDGGINNE